MAQAGITDEARQAIGSLLTRDGERILSVANGLRGADRSVESTVKGGSMGETLPAGTRIRIELETGTRLSPDDVIAFYAGTMLVVHRIIADIGRGRLITRGDATYAPDPPLERGNVLGRVTAMQRSGGDWAGVPAPRERSHGRRLVASILVRVIRTTTWIDARLASRVALGIHRVEARLRAIRGAGTTVKSPAAES